MAHAAHPDQSRSELQLSERIVYDKATGELVHVHRVLWRPDREAPAASVIDAEARRIAAQVGKCPEDTLDVLPVKLETLESDAAYAVDLQKKQLVKKAT